MLAALVFLLVLKVVVSLWFLLVASSHDLKSRLVPNGVWKYFLPIAFLFGVVECVLFGFVAVSWFFVSVGLTCALAFGGFYFKLFGGADAKCLLCLGLCFPFFPFTYLPGFVFFVFLVGSAIAVCYNIMLMGLYNGFDLVRGCLCFPRVVWWRKVALFFGATRVSVSKVDGLMWASCESVVSDQPDGGGGVWARFQGAFVWYLTCGFAVGLGVWVAALLVVLGVL